MNAVTRTLMGPIDIIKKIRTFTTFSQSLFKYKESVNVDSAVMKMHSMITVYLLLTGTFFITMKTYFGDPITCLSSKTEIPAALIQHYCWLEGSFTVVSGGGQKRMVPHNAAYPGVTHFNGHMGDRKFYHKYYQWVYFVLIIQAILFYVPRYIWKAKEGRRLRELIGELSSFHILEQKKYDQARLIQDVVDTLSIGTDYYVTYFLCHLFYLFHAIVQMWFTNVFLGGTFLQIGVDWFRYNHDLDEQDLYYADPLIRIFPRLTKCVFHKYGYSGSVETIDSLCFMPLNIVNEKIYVVMWFWFIFLILFTTIYVLWSSVYMCSSRARFYSLHRLAPSTNKRYLRQLTQRVGNWFFLDFLVRYMKPSHFRDLVEEMMHLHFDGQGRPLGLSKLKDVIVENGAPGGKSGVKTASAPSKSKYSSKSKSSKAALVCDIDPTPSYLDTGGNEIGWKADVQQDDWNDETAGFTGNTFANNDSYNNNASNNEPVDWPE